MRQRHLSSDINIIVPIYSDVKKKKKYDVAIEEMTLEEKRKYLIKSKSGKKQKRMSRCRKIWNISSIKDVTSLQMKNKNIKARGSQSATVDK